MPRFRAGERVQLVGDIARFYACIVGIIIDDSAYPASVLNQYKVRLADGTIGVFFDFQLETPPAFRASVIFDSSAPKKGTGTRGAAPGRHVQLVSREVELQIRISGTTKKSIFGQVTDGGTPVRMALVSLLFDDQAIMSKSSDDAGEFELTDVPTGNLLIEILMPGRRVVALLNI